MKKSRLKEIILEEIANVMANPLTEGVGDKILKAIPDGYHYKKLAADIASIVKVEFGSHNIKPFMKELTSLLRESIKLSEGTSKFVVYVGTKTNPTVHAVVDSKSKADAMVSKLQKDGKFGNIDKADYDGFKKQFPNKLKESTVSEAVNENQLPDKKDLSIINKSRAKAALKQIKSGKRDDGMGKFTDRLFGITSAGDVQQITDVNAINRYTKFGLAEAADPWKRFDKIQNLRVDNMDIERDMIDLAKQIKQVHKDMEQEGDSRSGSRLTKLESQYKKKKTELNKLLAKLDKLEQY